MQALSLRSLADNHTLPDFCSNDYLGFSASSELKEMINSFLSSFPDYPLGSTGSRLISGNRHFTEELETEIASFHGSGSSLLFNSGYDANLGLFSSLPQRGDTIIVDELAHASIIDGARLSYANRYTFRHNDLQSLEDKLKAAKGNIYIAVESIYSMDGDEAPLKALADLADTYGAALIVDEAHATGIFGWQGRGLINHYGLQSRIFARVITYGKALGSHGAAILGNNNLKTYLINFARSFIYSTAASFHSHLSIKMAYKMLRESDFQNEIRSRIVFFKQEADPVLTKFIPSASPIQSLLVTGNENAQKLASEIRAAGFNVRPILYPAVPVDKERIRICLHTFNSEKEISSLVTLLKEIL